MSSENCSCLIVAPDFFGYSNEIKIALQKRGVNSLVFDDRPATDTLTKMLIRLSPRILKKKADLYFDNIIEIAKKHPITEIFVIKGQALSVDAIRRFRQAFPDARFTLYFWDSYRNMSYDSRDKVGLFDRAFTFDPIDAEQDPRLKYRALFYLDEYSNLPNVKQDIDVFFFGTIHSDRYQVLCKIEKTLPPHIKIKKILYFSSNLVYWVRRFLQPAFWKSKKSEFVFKPVSKTELKMLMARSRVILDIERPVQAGLTMRTLEAIGAKKKMITTNPFAGKSDIYHPENILIIDRKNIVIPEKFFSSDFSELCDDIKDNYTLDGWLDEIFLSKTHG